MYYASFSYLTSSQGFICSYNTFVIAPMYMNVLSQVTLLVVTRDSETVIMDESRIYKTLPLHSDANCRISHGLTSLINIRSLVDCYGKSCSKPPHFAPFSEADARHELKVSKPIWRLSLMSI
jgi:hypothetical protein